MHRQPLTETFRASLSAAQGAARELNQDFVGTEHLMLGVLATDGDATKALRAAHGEQEHLTRELEAVLPRGAEAPVVTGDLPLSPKAQRAVNAAVVKSQSLRREAVSSSFLMLALLEDSGNAVRSSLDACGVDVDTLQRKLLEKPAAPET